MREALRVNPDFGDAHFGLGNVLARQGEFKDAIEEYQTVLRIDPQHAGARRALDAALSRSGRGGTARP